MQLAQQQSVRTSAGRSARMASSRPLIGRVAFAAPSRVTGSPTNAKAVAQARRATRMQQRLTARAITGALGATCAMNIVFVSAEVAPWSKTGGLGDVVGGLPIELAKRGHHVLTISPRYDQYSDAWDTSVTINVDGEEVRFFHAVKKGVHRVFVDHPWFLARVWGKTGGKLYGQRSGADYVDNHKRFALFCKAAVEACNALPFGPGEDCTFVANDWHSALVPVLIKDLYQKQGRFTKAKTALCIHNIAFQGRFFPETFSDMGLPADSISKFYFQDGYNRLFDENNPLDDDENPLEEASGPFSKINWLKAGILAADKVLTVSPNYATEISTDSARGVELDSVIRMAGGIEGIVNGMDIEEWDPKKDKFLDVKYGPTTVFEGKAAAKAALQAELGLPVDPTVPVFGYIGRLEEQKGSDILLAALPKIAGAGNCQVAILGTGKAKYETMLKAASNKLPGVKGVVKFSTPIAHLITAGADYILVPSRFEPCGLIQLHAMHYGTVPLVSSTGGLVDTVKEGVTGFHMGEMDRDKLAEVDAEAIAATMERAIVAYRTGQWRQMVSACISQDLSWSKPATKWEAVLEEMSGSSTSGSKKSSVATPVQVA